MGKRKAQRAAQVPVHRKPEPSRFAWFFGYHVFDLVRVRELAERKPVLTLTTVDSFAPLLEDGYVDEDYVTLVSVFRPVTIGLVPLSEGVKRYVLLEGYETCARCVREGVPLRLRVLSQREAKACRIDSESLGDWN